MPNKSFPEGTGKINPLQVPIVSNYKKDVNGSYHRHYRAKIFVDSAWMDYSSKHEYPRARFT